MHAVAVAVADASKQATSFIQNRAVVSGKKCGAKAKPESCFGKCLPAAVAEEREREKEMPREKKESKAHTHKQTKRAKATVTAASQQIPSAKVGH